MFGTLRLILAAMVALSHVGVSIGPYHLGVPAVVVFFMLSGYVIDSLCGPGGPLHAHPTRFYAERALRLLPLYYLALAAGVVQWQLGIAQPWRPDAALADPWAWLANLVILPLNHLQVQHQAQALIWVPPAWSLALELQFYLLAPWLLARTWRLLAAALLTAAVGSAAHAGWLPSDAWGYRYPMGTLWIFLSGAWLHRVITAQAARWPLWLAWIAAALLSLALLPRWQTPFVAEVLVGYLLGLPLLWHLARLPRRAWDDAMAHLAYGVFLLHFAVWSALAHLGWVSADHAQPRTVYLLATVAAAALGHALAERPLRAWRHRLRRAHVLQPRNTQ